MPIYEYLCNSCGVKKEHIQKMSDAPIEICPECGGADYTKLISAAGFQLKGSGWYVTDFKNKPASTSTAAQSEKSKVQSSPESKAGSQTDSKTDAAAAKPSETKTSATTTSTTTAAD